MRTTVWFLVALLIVLHQLNLFGDDATLVGGVFPVTLLYHVAISVAAGITWFLAVQCAWPQDLVDDAAPPVHSEQDGGAA
jgi:hypothetical protein